MRAIKIIKKVSKIWETFLLLFFDHEQNAELPCLWDLGPAMASLAMNLMFFRSELTPALLPIWLNPINSVKFFLKLSLPMAHLTLYNSYSHCQPASHLNLFTVLIVIGISSAIISEYNKLNYCVSPHRGYAWKQASPSSSFRPPCFSTQAAT